MRLIRPKANGRFGNVLLDFLISTRLTQRLDQDKTDPMLAALYRQVIFLGERDRVQLSTEVGFLDSGLPDTRLEQIALPPAAGSFF